MSGVRDYPLLRLLTDIAEVVAELFGPVDAMETEAAGIAPNATQIRAAAIVQYDIGLKRRLVFQNV